MKKILIFGTGTFAELVYYYLNNDHRYEVVGFTKNKDAINESTFFDLPVYPFENLKKQFSPEDYSMFIAIGYVNQNKTRTKIYEQAKGMGYELISYISPKATTYENLIIGDNCFVFENNVIQPFVKIGNNVILWSGNHVGHHSTIDDHCFVSSHVVISGHVRVESFCFLGVNSTIRDGVIIKKNCIVGANSLILKDTLPNSVYTSDSGKLMKYLPDDITQI